MSVFVSSLHTELCSHGSTITSMCNCCSLCMALCGLFDQSKSTSNFNNSILSICKASHIQNRNDHYQKWCFYYFLFLVPKRKRGMINFLFFYFLFCVVDAILGSLVKKQHLYEYEVEVLKKTQPEKTEKYIQIFLLICFSNTNLMYSNLALTPYHPSDCLD
jgi:coproporphyrinogen III oxidase